MEAARWRAVLATIRSLEEVRPRKGGRPVALRCTMPGCSACAAFEAERRDDFEKRLGDCLILEWMCTQRRADLAMQAGVTDVPAYILLTHADTRVVRP
jgi:hypothetical protein